MIGLGGSVFDYFSRFFCSSFYKTLCRRESDNFLAYLNL